MTTHRQLQALQERTIDGYRTVAIGSGHGRVGQSVFVQLSEPLGNRFSVQAELLNTVAPGRNNLAVLRSDAGEWYAIGNEATPTRQTVTQNRRQRLQEPDQTTYSALFLNWSIEPLPGSTPETPRAKTTIVLWAKTDRYAAREIFSMTHSPPEYLSDYDGYLFPVGRLKVVLFPYLEAIAEVFPNVDGAGNNVGVQARIKMQCLLLDARDQLIASENLLLYQESEFGEYWQSPPARSPILDISYPASFQAYASQLPPRLRFVGGSAITGKPYFDPPASYGSLPSGIPNLEQPAGDELNRGKTIQRLMQFIAPQRGVLVGVLPIARSPFTFFGNTYLRFPTSTRYANFEQPLLALLGGQYETFRATFQGNWQDNITLTTTPIARSPFRINAAELELTSPDATAAIEQQISGSAEGVVYSSTDLLLHPTRAYPRLRIMSLKSRS
jgi:hypothetical protein